MANTEFKIISKEINERICRNLRELLEARNYTVKGFVKAINENSVFCTRQHFANLIAKPAEKSMPISIVLLCCDFFGITIENLLSENFNPNERIELDSENYREYLEIEKILAKTQRKDEEKASDEKTMPNYLNMAFQESSAIVTDPCDRLFQGYLRDYHCYYYPTNSEANRNSEQIFYGSLKLLPFNGVCRAEFKVDNERYQKIYLGQAFISSVSQNFHVIMYEKEKGEFCFLSMRFVALEKGDPFCRIAEVLSSSSLDEERRPTVLRMFLSSEKIEEEHMYIVQSSIRLNYSKIAVTEQSLENVASISEVYEKIVSRIRNDADIEKMYVLDERRNVDSIAQSITNSDEVIMEFIAHLRNSAYSFKYNKVSDKADKNIRELLKKKGYY